MTAKNGGLPMMDSAGVGHGGRCMRGGILIKSTIDIELQSLRVEVRDGSGYEQGV